MNSPDLLPDIMQAADELPERKDGFTTLSCIGLKEEDNGVPLYINKNTTKKGFRGGRKMEDRAFDFINLNQRESKPRSKGNTEIRGPYYTPMGRRYLEDLLETMGDYIDSLKFAGGSFVLFKANVLREIEKLAHRYNVLVSTGGFIEKVLMQGKDAVEKYITECRDIGFDIIELSAGFICLPEDDWLRLSEMVRRSDLKPKIELGIQFGVGGASPVEQLEAQSLRDAGSLARQARRFLDSGAYMIMIESEGITENVRNWRTDVVSAIVNELGTENLMFEAADPDVFAWYIQNFSADVNLFVDHSQIVQLEALRSGLWGTKALWGRIVTYK